MKQTNTVIQFLSAAPSAISEIASEAKDKLESLHGLPQAKATELSNEIKDLALLTVDAVGATVCAMIACD